ncbi:MAG: hypothetical protein ACFE8U_13595 [Candidatus Hermodarchaeota archaeon]
MEEKESISYILLLAIIMFIMPATLGKGSAFYELSRIIISGVVIFLAIAMILIAVKIFLC